MRERIRWLDTAKGFAIFLVVVGHSISPPVRNNEPLGEFLYNLIYAFHMPFFVFLSGYGFALAEKRYAVEAPKSFLKRKAKTFLVPYVTWNFLVYLVFVLAGKIRNLEKLVSYFGKNFISPTEWLQGLLTGSNMYCQPMWYLYSLFLYFVLGYVLLHLFPQNRFKRAAVGFFIAGICLFIRDYTEIPLVTGWDKTTYFLIWFVLGWQCSMLKLSVPKAAACTLIPFFIFVGYEVYPVLRSTPYLVKFLRVFVITAEVFGLVNLFPYIKGKTESLFWFIGRHSMEIFLFHQPFLSSGIGGVLYIFMGVPAWICISAAIGGSIVLPILVGHIIKKIPVIRKLFNL